LGTIEPELGGDLLQCFLKKGCAGHFEGRGFRILHQNEVIKSFSDSQSRFLDQVIQKKAMTPTHRICQTGRQSRDSSLQPIVRLASISLVGESEVGHGNLGKVIADDGDTQGEGEILDVN
jgi:hypothetical protein